jgi:hypothetical protein
VYDSVPYVESTTKPCGICADKYDYVAVDSSVQKGLFKSVVDASNPVNCSAGSRVFATNVETNQVYSTPLKNQGNMTCVANWYGVFENQYVIASNSSFTVTFAFTNLGANVTLWPSYSSRLGAVTTIRALTEPQLIVSSITSQAVGTTTEYETTVQLSLGAGTQGCTFPSTINLVLGNGAAANCRPSAASMTTGAPGQYKWLHTYEPVDITGCGADTSNALYFQLPLSLEISYAGSNWAAGAMPSDRVWCFGESTVTGPRSPQCFGDTAQVRPAIASNQSSNIFINKKFMSDSTGAMNRVALSIVSYGATPCTGEIFSAQGTPYMTIKATGLSPSDVANITWSATDQVLQSANLVNSTDCGDADANTTCVVFTQAGCQAMNNFIDGTCSFANEDKLLTVSATNNAGSTTTILNPSLPNSFTTCSVVKTTQNVTAQYNISFSASRDDGVAGISLYRPIVSTVELTNLNSSGPLSFYITDVTVQLRAGGKSLASRTFTRAEKQRLMRSLTSPYYADSHYCRSETCSSFYSLYSNPLTTASSSTYNVNGGYKSCTTVMNQDRFVFTPSDWGMDRYIGNIQRNLDMRFIITAIMTPCGSVGRRLTVGKSSTPQVTYIDITKKLNVDVCQNKNPKTCANVKSCTWAANPTQSRATCVAKSTVSHWACENILSTTTCSSNKACKIAKNKKCIMK